jgi:hypothetical protein
MGRTLTSEEQAEARIVFGAGLDYTRILIREHQILGAGGIARTLPGSVNFPRGASATGTFLPWLVHELTHTWQYQHGIGLGHTATTALLCWAGLRSYDYGGEAALAAATTAGRGLRSFNTEQQADIARDYYLAVKAGRPVDAYLPFVTELRAL